MLMPGEERVGVHTYIHGLACWGGVHTRSCACGCLFVGWVVLEGDGVLYAYGRRMGVWLRLHGVNFRNEC